MSIPIEQWTASLLEGARDDLRKDLDKDLPGTWPEVFYSGIQIKLDRLLEEQGELDVETTDGRRRYHEIRGEREALKSLMDGELGLNEIFDDLIGKAPCPR